MSSARTGFPVSYPGVSRPGRRGGRRAAFRAWRKSRPFWGGFLLLLAGIELLAIPLSGVLVKGQVRLVIYIGIGGIFGVLIGALLIAAGIAVWLNPVQRVFYGIAGVIGGIASFPASNLGGFFIGMLLAIIGGALAFAWAPAGAASPPSGPEGFGTGAGPRAGPGYRVVALGGLIPCLVFCASAPSPVTSPSASGSMFPSSPGPGGTVPAVKRGSGAAAGAAGKARGKKPAAAKAGPVNLLTAPGGVVAPSATSVISARSSTMTRFDFADVATLPAGVATLPAGGGSERVLAFTASSASLSGVSVTVTQDGKTVETTTASVGFPGGMVLYTTKLCGRVEGIAPALCFTPGTASQVALKLASVLGRAAPVSMTDVTASQFITVAPASQWGSLRMAAAS